MPPRDCVQLLAAIESACKTDKEREACRTAATVEAQRLAPHLPWMHRTGRAHAGPSGANGKPSSWKTIFATGRLAPSPVKAHEALDGRSASVYFFVGACAFPKGNIVLVFQPENTHWLPRATFTPFDTGSLIGFAALDLAHPAHERYAPWTEREHCRYLQDHSGAGLALGKYLPTYLAAHFHRPADYVTRPQISSPDLPAVHGLRSASGDRRTWTVEVQLEGEAGAPLDSETLLEIIVVGKDRFDALPARFKSMARVLDEDDDHEASDDTLAAACAERTLQRAEEGAP